MYLIKRIRYNIIMLCNSTLETILLYRFIVVWDTARITLYITDMSFPKCEMNYGIL